MKYTHDSNDITRQYFDSILLETRYIGTDLPSTKIELYGETFDTPITTAALSHLHDICENGMEEFARGAKDAKAMHMVGMGEDDELEGILNVYNKTAKFIKPHENDDVVYQKIEHAQSHGAFAVGMDIDHCLGSKGTYDVVLGLPMKTKSLDQMKDFVKASKVPFIVKGVLSVQDAVRSVEAGAQGIIVSHHHGIMNYAVPPLMILPEIVKAVDGQLKIFVDCGIESGMDVFKALALGADAVCVGRDLMGPLKQGGKGVTDRINELNLELMSIMARTGAKSLDEIDPSVVHFRNF